MRQPHSMRTWLAVLVCACAICASASAMTPEEQVQFDRIYHAVESRITDANNAADRGIAIIETTDSLAEFVLMVERVNLMMTTCIRDLQPWVDRLSALSGVRYKLECEYVRVYNRILRRSALVDPIHLTSSGD